MTLISQKSFPSIEWCQQRWALEAGPRRGKTATPRIVGSAQKSGKCTRCTRWAVHKNTKKCKMQKSHCSWKFMKGARVRKNDLVTKSSRWLFGRQTCLNLKAPWREICTLARLRMACGVGWELLARGRTRTQGESFSRWPMRTSMCKQVHLQGGDFLAGECFFGRGFFCLQVGVFLFVEKCVFGGDVALAGKCAGMQRTREEEHWEQEMPTVHTEQKGYRSNTFKDVNFLDAAIKSWHFWWIFSPIFFSKQVKSKSQRGDTGSCVRLEGGLLRWRRCAADSAER